MQLVLSRRTGLFTAMALAVCLAGTVAAGAAMAEDDLGELSLDQLMGITITSASKKEQSADEVASAIFVLTQEDIRRSGATSIPEALRLVPGLQVAQTTANAWAITARGFSGRFASKLLVLIDGRSVYTPLFSGVYWDVQDTLLEDIERIEVIRGPGATVWGSNAVNGVINIITKKAADTQGILAHAGGGNEERGFAGARYGGSLGDDLHYRAYAKYFNRDGFQTAGGAGTQDDWDIARGGFRMEWSPGDSDVVTLQGDGYDGDAGMTFAGITGLSPLMTTFDEDQQLHGWNVLGRWSHTFSEEMDASAQFYYDRTDRSTPLIDETRHTYDFEFQHRVVLPFSQEVIWGGGYRYTEDRTRGSFSTAMVPTRRHDDTFSFFVQDEIRFFDDRVRLTMGTKVEKNDYTGWEYQPSLRMAVLPHEDHTVWGAVSRAVRVPSRADDNALLNLAFAPFTPAGMPSPLDPTVICPALPLGGCPATLVQTTGTGTRTSLAERLYAFELGWRARFFERLTLDVAAFYNDYNYIESFETGAFTLTGFAPPSGIQNVLLANGDNARTWGVETDVRADLTEWWRIIVGYTFLKNHKDALDVSHQGLIRSQIDLPWDLELDATLHLIGNLRVLAAGTLSISPLVSIPSYERLDLRLAWHPTEHLELSIVGQNLLDDRHPEYAPELGIATSEIQRSVYGKITFRH